ncbi:MAG: hypothetical protein DRG59_09800 [Deltaproteobacteria bacterium]|nr:MAG: hypothetical protein DRG59_09800 [Deltaproteobacteria bacterium]
MNKYKLVRLVVVALFIGSSFISGFVENTSGDTVNEIYVNESYFGYSDGSADKPYKTIQKALDVAKDGATIYIFGGFYQENLIINKQVRIVGSIDEIDTVIDSRFDDRYLIEVTADHVTIEGLTVSDSDESTTSPIGALICLKSNDNHIINNNITNTRSYGIYVDSNSKNNLISRNYINNTKVGIYVYSSTTNDIANNEINNCSQYGIYLENSPSNNRLYGNILNSTNSGITTKDSDSINITRNTIIDSSFYSISLYNCNNFLIINNTIKNSESVGIYLKSSNGGTIKENFIYNNTRGIFIDANSNIIKNNTISSQKGTGIYAYYNTKLNKIYLNKFDNNGVSAKDLGNNQWYYLEQGNYWSDYNDIDLDLNGVGDNPYTKNGVYDMFPLGYFLKPPKKPSDPHPKDFETGVGLHITLDVLVEDPDSDELTVYFYNAENDALIDSLTQNPLKRVKSGSRAQCEFTLGFNRTYAWYVIVDDGVLQNRSDTFIFYTRKTPPDNEPPVIDSGGPYYGKINETIEFNASGCYDPDGKIDFYRWNFGDGTSEILEKVTSHRYLNAMTYEVTLTVIDNDGGVASEITYAYIGTEANNPPTAIINAKKQGYVGEKIRFSSGSSDPDGDSLSYNWSFGDGQTSTEKNPIHVYNKKGEYIVELTVTDEKGLSDYTSMDISIKESKKGIPGFEFLFLITILLAIIVYRKLKD